MRLMSSPALPRGAIPEVSPPPAHRKTHWIDVLDALILLYSAAVLLIWITGGIDLGFISMQQAAKPILVLCIIVPLRVTLGGSSWVARWAQRVTRATSDAWAEAVRKPAWAAVIDSLFAVLITRTATFLIGFLTNVLFPPARARSSTMPFESEKFAEIFAAWDSGWYFDIARRGYYYDVDGQSSTAFFPLYPMAMRALAWPFGGSDRAIWAAGILISCVAFVAGLVALHRFTYRVTGSREAARRTVLYVSVFPFSLFMTRVYTESLFLLTSVLAVSNAHGQQWARAGCWGALATLTRPNGVLIGLPLLLMSLADRPRIRELARRWACLIPIPAALAGFSLFVYSLSGDALGWMSAQAQWGYFLWNPPWEQLLRLLGRIEKYGLYDYFFVSPMAPFHFFNGLSAILFLALVPAVFKRLGFALGAYVLCSLLLPLSSNSLVGIGRYAAVLFPVFMLLGNQQSRHVHEGILIVGSLLLSLCVGFFVTQQPIF